MGDSGNAEGTQRAPALRDAPPRRHADQPVHVAAPRAGSRGRRRCARSRRTRRRTRRRRRTAATGRVDRDRRRSTRSAARRSSAAATGPRATTPVVDLGPRPNGDGYWLVDAAGDDHPFGDARPTSARRPACTSTRRSSASTPTGDRQGLLAARARRRHLHLRRRGVLRLDRRRCNSTRRSSRWRRRRPARATGSLGADGGIFTFGDAVFFGSTGGIKPQRAGRRHGDDRVAATGYWLLGGDGGMFAFGDAPFHGSIPGTGLCTRPGAVSLTGTNTGHGYWVLTTTASSCRSGTRCTTATRRPTAPSRSPSLPSADAVAPSTRPAP